MTSEQPTYEYRIGYTLTEAAPRGSGTFYGPVESKKAATSRMTAALSDITYNASKGRPVTMTAVWLEQRPVGPWEKVEQ